VPFAWRFSVDRLPVADRGDEFDTFLLTVIDEHLQQAGLQDASGDVSRFGDVVLVLPNLRSLPARAHAARLRVGRVINNDSILNDAGKRE
jgi:hypothetical protein